MKVRCGNKNCKKYIEKDSAVRAGISYYCDSACMYSRPTPKGKVSTAKRTTIRRRTTKKSGPTKQPGYPDSIFSRDGYSCRLCGRTQGLAVHHIFYRSDWSNKQFQEEFWNQLTLCNSPCHLDIVHGNKNKYQRLCLGVTWLREVEGINITIRELEKRENESD